MGDTLSPQQQQISYTKTQITSLPTPFVSNAPKESTEITYSGGSPELTQLGTWLSANKSNIDLTNTTQVAEYNSKVAQYNKLSAENPIIQTTTTTPAYKSGTIDFTTAQKGVFTTENAAPVDIVGQKVLSAVGITQTPTVLKTYQDQQAAVGNPLYKYVISPVSNFWDAAVSKPISNIAVPVVESAATITAFELGAGEVGVLSMMNVPILSTAARLAVNTAGIIIPGTGITVGTTAGGVMTGAYLGSGIGNIYTQKTAEDRATAEVQFASNLIGMGIGAKLYSDIVPGSTLTGKAANVNDYIFSTTGRVKESISDTIFSLQQKMAGQVNLGPNSGSKYYRGESTYNPSPSNIYPETYQTIINVPAVVSKGVNGISTLYNEPYIFTKTVIKPTDIIPVEFNRYTTDKTYTYSNLGTTYNPSTNTFQQSMVTGIIKTNDIGVISNSVSKSISLDIGAMVGQGYSEVLPETTGTSQLNTIMRFQTETDVYKSGVQIQTTVGQKVLYSERGGGTTALLEPTEKGVNVEALSKNVINKIDLGISNKVSLGTNIGTITTYPKMKEGLPQPAVVKFKEGVNPEVWKGSNVIIGGGGLDITTSNLPDLTSSITDITVGQGKYGEAIKGIKTNKEFIAGQENYATVKRISDIEAVYNIYGKLTTKPVGFLENLKSPKSNIEKGQSLIPESNVKVIVSNREGGYTIITPTKTLPSGIVSATELSTNKYGVVFEKSGTQIIQKADIPISEMLYSYKAEADLNKVMEKLSTESGKENINHPSQAKLENIGVENKVSQTNINKIQKMFDKSESIQRGVETKEYTPYKTTTKTSVPLMIEEGEYTTSKIDINKIQNVFNKAENIQTSAELHKYNQYPHIQPQPELKENIFTKQYKPYTELNINTESEIKANRLLSTVGESKTSENDKINRQINQGMMDALKNARITENIKSNTNKKYIPTEELQMQMQQEETIKSNNKPYKEYNPPKIKTIFEVNTEKGLFDVKQTKQQNTEKTNKSIGFGLADALKNTKNTMKSNKPIDDAFNKLSTSTSKNMKPESYNKKTPQQKDITGIDITPKTNRINKNTPSEKDITDIALDTNTDLNRENKNETLLGVFDTNEKVTPTKPERDTTTESITKFTPFVTPSIIQTPQFDIVTPTKTYIPPTSTKNPLSPFGFYFPEGVGGYGSRRPSSRNILSLNPITTRKSAANISNELTRSISSMNMSDLSNITLTKKSNKQRKRK